MSAALSSREANLQTVQPRPRTSSVLVAVAAAGGIFLAAAAVTLAAVLAAAWREHQAFLWLSRTPAVVIAGKIRPLPPAGGGPANLLAATEFRPELHLKYSLGGSELETWLDPFPDLPDADSWEAQERLTAFQPGDQVTLCYDPDDPATLRLQPRDRSWRNAILGCLLALVIAMPGLGLVLMAWLLGRRARPAHRSGPAGAPSDGPQT